MVPVKTNSNWLPSIFNDFFENEWLAKTGVTAPAINVIENDKDYKVEMAAPGMTKDDFKVNVDENNNLTICMEKKEEKKEEKKDKKYLRREFSYSKFQQTILLPENVEKDKISAKVEHGILSIEIPKVKEEESAAVPKFRLVRSQMGARDRSTHRRPSRSMRFMSPPHGLGSGPRGTAPCAAAHAAHRSGAREIRCPPPASSPGHDRSCA